MDDHLVAALEDEDYRLKETCLGIEAEPQLSVSGEYRTLEIAELAGAWTRR